MINPLTLLPPQVKLIGAIILALGLVYSGWYARTTIYEAKENKVKEAIIKDYKEQQDRDRNLIANHQTNEQKLQESYILLGKELERAKGKIGKCNASGGVTITESGRVLWNDIGKGFLSEDSTRTIETPTSSNPPVELDKLFENYKENAKICKRLRAQIEAIKEWDKATFGEVK